MYLLHTCACIYMYTTYIIILNSLLYCTVWILILPVKCCCFGEFATSKTSLIIICILNIE